MPEISIQFKPTFKKVGNAFKAIADGMELQRQLQIFAFDIERESKRVAPVDTGRLRASIFTSIGNLEARIKPNVNYAIYVHEGTRYMRARPFMMIGFEKATITRFGGKSPFVGHIETVIRDNIGRI